MRRIRLSYSLIDRWEKGDIQGAMDTFLHTDTVVSRQMEEGKTIHEAIAKHIKKKNELPKFFNLNYKLNNPEPEKQITVQYNEICDLKCYIDCVNTPDILEYKTGVSSSLNWSKTKQLPLYFLILELAGITGIEKAFVLHYDQYKKESDFVIVHNTPQLVKEARNYVDSTCYEIYKFFKDERLLSKQTESIYTE